MQARPAPPTRQRGGFLASEPLLLVALVILTLYFARDLVAPMAFALVLNFLLSPAVALLERWRLSRSVSVVLVILIFFSALVATGWVVARQLVHVAELLPDWTWEIFDSKDADRRAALGITHIPTFIMYDAEHGRELGRIVENPSSGSLEVDLLRIVQQAH